LIALRLFNDAYLDVQVAWHQMKLEYNHEWTENTSSEEAILYYCKVSLPLQHLLQSIRKMRTASSHVKIQTGYHRTRSLGLTVISLLQIHGVLSAIRDKICTVSRFKYVNHAYVLNIAHSVQ